MSELKADKTFVFGEECEAYKKSEADKVIAEKDKKIAELKDKCQMHDFFREGCGFAKRGFKNTIAVSEAYDFMEAENVQLKESIIAYQRNEKIDIHEIRHNKYKRCLAMARWCDTKGDWYYGIGESFRDRVEFYKKMA